jgi:Spy/CpxP family protein refolding chaperone
MSKIFGMVAAAALFASVTAFAQTPSSAPPSDPAAAPAAAPSDDDSAKPEKPMHKHGGHHRHMSGGNAGTDENADKLNACMSNATPTSQQESCLKQAAGSGNG